MSATSSSVSDAGGSNPPDEGLSSTGGSKKMSTGAIVGMVVGILGTLVLMALVLVFVQWVKRRKHRRDADNPGDAQPLTTQIGSGSGPGSNLQLVNGRLERVAGNTSNAQINSGTSGQRGRRSNRPHRYNQRQDSGQSIRSVPAYNDEAAEDEVVLMKPRPSTEELARMEQSASQAPQSSLASAAAPSDSPLSVQPSMFEQNNYSTSSMPLVDHQGTLGEHDPPVYVAQQQQQQHPSTLSRHSLALTPSSTLGFDEISLAETGDSHHLRASTDSGAHRPSHRATLSADNTSVHSTTSFFDHRMRSRLTNGRSAPSAKGNRARSHTTGSSRLSLPRPSSFILRGGNATTSQSTSSSSLVISAPLRDTLVSSSDSYVYPKRGLSPAQLSFLSSRESLALCGMPQTDNEPPSFELARSTSTLEDSQPLTSGTQAFSAPETNVTTQETIPLPPGAHVAAEDSSSPEENAAELPTPAIVVDTTSRTASPAPSPAMDSRSDPIEQHQPAPMSASSQRETLDDQILQQQPQQPQH